MTRIAAGLSTAEATLEAVEQAADQVASELGGSPIDLAFLFLTPHHQARAADAAASLVRTLRPSRSLGCVSSGVVGREQEIERGPALAIWAASLPDVSVATFHLPAGGDAGARGLPALEDLDEPDLLTLIVDPFSVRGGQLIDGLEDGYPGVPVVGGFATGAGASAAQALLLDGQVYESGLVGLALSGVSVEAIVSQGCAPLGPEAVITRAENNVVMELAGRPALTRLREIVSTLPPAERALAERGPVLAGLVVDENKPDYGPGDFLVRGILGADEQSGAIAIGENVRVGQTLRFHIRDATSAHRDLEAVLGERLSAGPAAGALLFTCNGRGAGMFEEPHHDSRLLSTALGKPSVAGFFCGGEIGPVGRRTYIHGFTATMAVFR